MSVKEHNEEDIIGDELQNSRQLSIDCDSVKISLRTHIGPKTIQQVSNYS